MTPRPLPANPPAPFSAQAVSWARRAASLKNPLWTSFAFGAGHAAQREGCAFESCPFASPGEDEMAARWREGWITSRRKAANAGQAVPSRGGPGRREPERRAPATTHAARVAEAMERVDDNDDATT